MNNKPPLKPPKNSVIDDFVYLIHHLQSTLFIIFSFLFIIYLINSSGLESSKDLVLFLMGGILGVVNPMGEKK